MILCDGAESLKRFAGIGKHLKGVRVNNLHSNRARIETVNTGQHFLNLEVAAIGVDDLLPQRVLLVVVESEVGTQSLVHGGIVVLENDFNAVPPLLLQQLPRNANLLIKKNNVSRIHPPPVHHQELYPRAVKVDDEGSVSELSQRKTYANDALV